MVWYLLPDSVNVRECEFRFSIRHYVHILDGSASYSKEKAQLKRTFFATGAEKGKRRADRESERVGTDGRRQKNRDHAAERDSESGRGSNRGGNGGIVGISRYELVL